MVIKQEVLNHIKLLKKKQMISIYSSVILVSKLRIKESSGSTKYVKNNSNSNYLHVNSFNIMFKLLVALLHNTNSVKEKMNYITLLQCLFGHPNLNEKDIALIDKRINELMHVRG